MSAYDELMRDLGPESAPKSASAMLAEDLAGPAVAKPPPKVRPQPEPLSLMDQLLAKVPAGLVNNPAVAGARNITTAAAAPMVGGAQFIANQMPESTGVPQMYNRRVAEVLRKDADAAKENPATAGFNSFTGAMISPMNLAMGANAVPAVTAGSRAVQGATIGAIGGATAPVEVGESGKYWGQKGVQTLVSTAGGAILGPVVGLVGDKVIARINAKGFNPANAAKEADDIVSGALKESNQRLEDIPPEQLSVLRKQVVDALAQGKRLDAAAAMRMKDFNAEKIVPTQGQITRDPMQFADEQTMKAMSRPLSQTMEVGNRKVTEGISQYGVNAQEGPVAAEKLAEALRKYDAGKSAEVTKAYGAARASSGKDLEIPLQGLAQDYSEILGRYSENVRKSLPTSAFEQYGLSGGKQSKVFTFEDADKLLKTINANKSTEPAVNAALGELRASVKRAIGSVDASGGPYAPAMKLAAQRFAEHESTPALEAAVSGQTGDDFVRKHIINADTKDVQKLAGLLRKENPEAYTEARNQIGAELVRKAFGENVAGDKPVAQESYNRALRSLGTAKLSAFFEPQEVEQLKRLGRIGAYQQSNPAAAASNFSNTAGALANLLRGAGGIPVAGKTLQTAGEKLGGYAATHAEVPVAANLTAEQRKALSRALTAITGGSAMTLPGIVGQ